MDPFASILWLIANAPGVTWEAKYRPNPQQSQQQNSAETSAKNVGIDPWSVHDEPNKPYCDKRKEAYGRIRIQWAENESASKGFSLLLLVLACSAQ